MISRFFIDWERQELIPDDRDGTFVKADEALGEIAVYERRIAELESTLTRCEACSDMKVCHDVGDMHICNDCHVDFVLSTAIAEATSEANKRITELEAQLAAEIASRAEGCKP